MEASTFLAVAPPRSSPLRPPADRVAAAPAALALALSSHAGLVRVSPTNSLRLPAGLVAVAPAPAVPPSAPVATLSPAQFGPIEAATRLNEPEASFRFPRRKPLPKEGSLWSSLEHDLYRLSGGDYNPTEMAAKRRVVHGQSTYSEAKGRVSMVTPTMDSRQHHHEQLWDNFLSQSYPDKELIVVESYEESPSCFLAAKALEDPRLVHVAFQRQPGEDFSVGLKRNMALHLASGEFIVNFDDDDIYAPGYVQEMVGEMRSRGLVAITLSTWFNYFVHKQEVAYSDPQIVWERPKESMSQQDMDEVLYGYGFSYAHLRKVGLMLPYPDVVFAEDAPFFLRLKQIYGPSRVALKKDTNGICMHLVHNANSAGDMPVVRRVSAEEVEHLHVAPIFQRYRQRNWSVIAPHLRSVVARIDVAVQSITRYLQTSAWEIGSADPRRNESC